MSVTIPLDTAQLARTRFGLSPAVEVVGVLRHRHHHPRRHARRWYARAARLLDPGQLELLHALVPADHPYIPDFLMPHPQGIREPMSALTERIAATPADLIDYHLDIGLAGRPVRANVERPFATPGAYRLWRRPTPPVLSALIARGPRAVAEESAMAMQAAFDAAVAPDWELTQSVLLDDLAYRADIIAAKGVGNLFDDLADSLSWTGSGLELQRPYDITVDWAHDGLLLVPCTTRVEVSYSAEDPLPPLVIYPARGTARLDARHEDRADYGALGTLLGTTRADLLARLHAPRSTQALSRECGMSMPTVSYHLGILARAGLVTKSRRGRRVLYRRTAQGESLIAAAPWRRAQR